MTTQNSILSFYSHISLNAQQEQATQQLESFFAQTEDQIFVLKGYAGTGKTTLLKGVLDYLESLKTSVIAMAPTGRAARVLGTKTEHITSTVHSAIFYVKFNQDGEPFYVLRESPANGSILFIDEASMLKCHPQHLQSHLGSAIISLYSQNVFDGFVPGTYSVGEYLLNDIMHFANLTENPNTKIVFIGDEAQLPPIGTTKSLVFDQSFLSSLGFGYQDAMLTKVERNDNGVLKAATLVRENLMENQLSDLYPMASQDVQIVKNAELVSTYLNDVKSAALAEDHILIFKSNNAVYDANMKVRSSFYKQYNPEQIIDGDRMMVYANSYGESNFFNGDAFSVLEVLGEKSQRTTVNLSDKEKSSLVKDRHAFEAKLFSCIELQGDKALVNLTLIQLRICDTDGNEDTIYISKDFVFTPLTDCSSVYRRALVILGKVAFKEYIKKCESKGIEPDAEELYLKRSPFSNCILAKFGYAITCHKAQGGEWKKVYTTICTIPKLANSLDHFKWVYTAYTRSSKSLVVGVPFVKNKMRPLNHFTKRNAIY